MRSYIESSLIICVMALCAMGGRAMAQQQQYCVIPYDVDPPIMLDGNLDDWGNVPNPIQLDGRAHVTYGGDKWTVADDLSGVIRLAWGSDGICLAAEVNDDKVQQPYSGGDIWKGDHVNLWMDFIPGVEPERTMFGKGQFHVVVSPGNFNAPAAGAKPIPPEIFVYRPEGPKQEGGKIAAVRTEKGYIVEAFVPWSRLGVSSIRMNQDANFEVAINDADADPARQEKLITLGEEPWAYSRLRLLPMVFGDGNGKGTAPARGSVIQKAAAVEVGKALTLEFDAPALPEDKAPFVFFKARIQWPSAAGWRSDALTASVNGKPLDAARFSNRSPRFTMVDGRTGVQVSREGSIMVWYSPTFDAVNKDSHYAPIDGAPACEYEFNLAGLVQPGRNTFELRNVLAVGGEEKASDFTIHIENVEYRAKVKLPPPPPPKPAPTGEIPVIEPKKLFARTYSDLTQSKGRIAFSVKGRSLAVTSRFSTPDGQWRAGSNTFFTIQRVVKEHDEWIEVRDTFRNLTQEDLPIIQEHACDLGKSVKRVWLAGLPMYKGAGGVSAPGNPSAMAVTDTLGIGLMPLNDEFLVHINQVARDGTIMIRDGQFYLKPGAEYTAEWAIVPVAEPDFWGFVNAARRLRNVNYPLKLCFAFLFHKPPVYEWSDDTLRAFITNKGVNFAVKTNDDAIRNKEGHYARGCDWVAGPHDDYVNLFKRIGTLFPDGSVKTGVYYDCFLDTTRANDEKFKADRALDSAGNHIYYGGAGNYMHLFIPTLEKGHWGEEVAAKVIDAILNKAGADGVYQDEFTHSEVWYVYGHLDGCSADIDGKTFKLVRKKGSLPLLSREFRYEHTKRILDAGRPFSINGAPCTRTLLNLKFQAFTETGTISNCAVMLLHSPIALGDALTERNYLDCYRNMLAALDYGCLYAWFGHIHHPHKAPTGFMYPFTPIELHSGYVIGRERIITKVSGLFGWGDAAEFVAQCFDGEGKPTDAIKVPRVMKDGKAYAEVRLPEDCMAIIVRAPAAAIIISK